MKRKKAISFVVVIVLLIFWIGWTNFNITTTNIEIKNNKIPSKFDGFKIAQVSDLHNHQWEDKLIHKIRQEHPEIIAITGDLVDSSKPDFEIALEFIEEANKIAPIYYVTGNHEAWLEDYHVLKEKLEEANVNIMDDQILFIQNGKSEIRILGIQDPDFDEQMDSENIQEKIVHLKKSRREHKDYFNILLSHRPEYFEQYVNVEVDLVLTGHAHGGQVRIPFLGGLVAPNQGFFPKYTSGLYYKKNTDMVVSRGLGNSIIPIRINNTPELVIIELKTE